MIKKLIQPLLKTLIFSQLMLAVSMPTFAQSQSVIDEIIDRGSIRVGMSAFVPWAFLNEQGEYVGFEIDVAKKLAEDLGVELQLVPTAWDGIIPSLQTGKMDVIIGGMSVTTKRNLKINFSIPYAGGEYVLMANMKDQNKFTTFKQFNSRKVTLAVRRGSIPAILAKGFFPKARLRQFDDDGVSAQEVVNGNADGTIENSMGALNSLENHQGELFLVGDGEVIAKLPAAFALRKGDPDALNVFNNWIRVNQANGFLQTREDYWFKSRDWKKK